LQVVRAIELPLHIVCKPPDSQPCRFAILSITFAGFLGTVVTPSPHGIPGAVMGLFAIFLPGILALLGTLPFCDSFSALGGIIVALTQP